MYRQIITMFRGHAYTAAEELIDQNALTILRQQIRDSTRSIQISKRAIATAMSQQIQEVEHYENTVQKIADLETRALTAIEKGRDDLAYDAADALAALESEKEASEATQRIFTKEISVLKGQLREAQSMLGELKRGERLATAANSMQGMNERHGADAGATLMEARETLARLQKRQLHFRRTAEAMKDLNNVTRADFITEKLAQAGCGEPVKKTAEDVLKRLKSKSKKNKKAE